ncbi:hypothetical protein SLEP1_g38215 [Rubroshorea leprosula]|uniref:Uncharacterized protein n=1 Tax=Rubroshorea leprosula TaxID=152421 RepID=A0AAV5KXG8_9ROSI|nr:hypothetical protein SLEP1_g38215 [Rubroshorea leprosula]
MAFPPAPSQFDFAQPESDELGQGSPQPTQPQFGSGRGRVASESSAANESSLTGQSKQLTFISKKDVDGFDSAIEAAVKPKPTQSSETNLPSSILSVLPGAGGGKPLKQSDPAAQVKEENHHLRVRQQPSRSASAADPHPAQPKLSQEEAVKKAMGILSREGDGEDAGGMVRARAEGGRGRGRGRRRRRGRGRGRGERRMVVDRSNAKYSEEADDPYAGDEADEEKLIQEIGRENVNSIVDGFLDASSRVVHSPLDDAYLDAFHTNCLIECEPEYLMGDFGTNPDIDDKSPIPLCDALRKAKRFLMAYEGIQSQEEWESNPGWGFDKKFQFMDKLAREKTIICVVYCMGISEEQSLENKQDVKHNYNMRWETFYGMKFLFILGGKLWLWTYH